MFTFCLPNFQKLKTIPQSGTDTFEHLLNPHERTSTLTAEIIRRNHADLLFPGDMHATSLVFLDESGVNMNLTRRYGRAKGKGRVKGSVPLNTPKVTTIVSSVRLDGTTVSKFLSGAMNGSMFLDYIQHKLVPSLHVGDLVIMDNLRCHKVKGIKEAILQTGAQLLYLPPYSPDFNPIEMMWSKLKAVVQK